MSKHRPVRQDYIAKPRYINSLPPPPANPRFIRYGTSQPPTHEHEHLMSSLFRKENFHPLLTQVDEHFGMPINLLMNTGVLDGSNPDAVGELKKPLHPHDLALLRDAGIGRVNKLEPGVLFLRRTEYISERLLVLRGRLGGAETENQAHDPEDQLRAVEQSFEHAQALLRDCALLQHPRKRRKAVRAWPLLPDTQMMDATYVAIKFVGLASVSREVAARRRQSGFDEPLELALLACALYKPVTCEDGEWVLMYQLQDRAGVARVTQQLQLTQRERPAAPDGELWLFAFARNYDMQFHRFAKGDELALRFANDRRTAYYYPVLGRVELRKHRAVANEEVMRFLANSTADAVRFRLREPDTRELRKMDSARSEYDPMEYDAGEGEGEKDGEEKEGENEGEEKEEKDKTEEGEDDVAAQFDEEEGRS